MVLQYAELRRGMGSRRLMQHSTEIGYGLGLCGTDRGYDTEIGHQACSTEMEYGTSSMQY
eukprot:680577-Rhodomonas_salina.1